jgi:WD40 repeat protein
MNCEKAENNLSAYLDDMLDLQLREEVAAHLESCASCSEVVAEYRRYDILLRDTPRVSPPPELRGRIFASPQYAAILRREAKAGDGSSGGLPPRPYQSPPRWTRVALQSAAVLAIIIGSALLFKQGFFHSSPTTTGHTSTPIIGNNPQTAPLPAGSRVVYEHNGALWSAPEVGPGVGEQLTPINIQVGNIWSVSPDGRLVAYIEAATGRIHVIRADRLNDVAFASYSAVCSNSSCAVHPTLVWSPDGNYLAYLSIDGTLHVVNADGSLDRIVVTSEQGVATSLLWSSDSLRLAFIRVNGSLESIWNYNLNGSGATEVAASIDPAKNDASVEELFWLNNANQPTLTWVSWQKSTGSVTGIFSADVLGSPAVQRLTPANAKLTAAGFNPLEGTGTWLVGITDDTGAPEIATVEGSRPGLVITNADFVSAFSSMIGTGTIGTINGIYWSPNGDTVAVVTTTGQMALARNNGASLSPIFSSNVTGAPVWSPDGTHLATPLSFGVMSLDITSGSLNTLQPSLHRLLPSVPALITATMLWSPNSQDIAITSPSGTYLTSSDGKSLIKQVDAATATGPFAWSHSGYA